MGKAFVVKVPGINGLGKTKGCEGSGNAILRVLKEEIYSSELGKSIDFNKIDLEEIHLDNSDLELSVKVNRILIDDSISGDKLVWIDIDLTQIQVDRNMTCSTNCWNNISSIDEDYLSNYGILVSNPEDSCEDEEFTLVVPENRLEGSISLI